MVKFKKNNRRTRKRGGARQRGGKDDPISRKVDLATGNVFDESVPLEKKQNEASENLRQAYQKQRNQLQLTADVEKFKKTLEKEEKATPEKTPEDLQIVDELKTNKKFNELSDQAMEKLDNIMSKDIKILSVDEVEIRGKRGKRWREHNKEQKASLSSNDSPLDGGKRRKTRRRRNQKKKAKKTHRKKPKKSRRKRHNTRKRIRH